MSSAKQMVQKMSLRTALRYTGISRNMWYYTQRPRTVGIDPTILLKIKKIGGRRPTYGTRRMAAQISRETKKPTNRKKIQRIYRKIGWIEPQKTKNEIIRSKRKLFKPSKPNQLWEMDITYISCGIDGNCYCFNVLDCFTRKWIAYAFNPNATADMAVQSLTDAVAVEKPDCSELRIRTDNGSQYTSKEFRKAVKAFGILHERIWKNTPQQNGHVESFHKTFKREYIWPHEFASYQKAEKTIAKAFVDYNMERIHSSIGYMTPEEFESKWKERN